MTPKMRFHRTLVLVAAAMLLASPVLAGVVFEVETTYHSGSSRGPDSQQMSVEGENLKMEMSSSAAGASGGPEDEAIFRGDLRHLVVVDHRERSYTVIDDQMIEQFGNQMQQAMKELEKQLEGLDPQQREMMEKMLQGRMGQAGAVAMPQPSPTEVRNTGERATHQGYPCVRYEVAIDGVKVRELWVTGWDNVEGGEQVVGVFREMADFFSEMMESFSQTAGGIGFLDAGRNPVEDFAKIEGFPIVTRSYAGGELESESVLKSVTERRLGPEVFEPPKGYRLRTMGPR